MRVLITRPRADAEALATKLHALGHTAFVEPLIDIALADGPLLDLIGVQALLFTSANGVRAAARRSPERARPVLAVGPTTAAEAKTQGFADVRESNGEGVEGLAHFAQATLNPSHGTLLHITGSVSAGDLMTSLAPKGFSVRTERLYDAKQAETLTGALAAELGASQIDAAMFFSPRTAAIFVTLIRTANLEPACTTVTALALSQAVADALKPLAFREIRIAAHANAQAMLDLLGSA